MSRPVTGKVSKSLLWIQQKDGSYYCYERQRIWKDGRDITTKKLLGKADAKNGELRPTRHKRSVRSAGYPNLDCLEEGKAAQIVAFRKRTGMMDIIDFIGRSSGIDEDLINSTDLPTAQKILSLARYIVGTDGATFPGIEEWMLTHPVPYTSPITEDVYRNLFDEVGSDETLRQTFFKHRLDREEDLVMVVAYDSSTETSVSQNPEARMGMNKDHNGKTSVKIIGLYSLKTRRPLIYGKQPANIPDVISVKNVLNQFAALGVKKVLLVTDGGYSSDENLGEIFHAQDHALTRVKIGWKWVKSEIDKHEQDLRSVLNIMETDVHVKGITVPLTREFKYRRVRGSARKKLSAGDYDTFQRRVYLHIYYDTERKELEDREFMTSLMEIKSLLESGQELNEQARNQADKYLVVNKAGESLRFDGEKIEQTCRYHGIFALVSDYCKTANEALDLYRKREWIEDYFERFQQNADGNTSRTGKPENLAGRLFVQFIAMCYIEDIHERIRVLKSSLAKMNGDSAHDTKEVLDKEKDLKNWLKKRSMFRVLNWFDANETVEVSSEITKRRWNTEVIERDALFLKLLGVTP